MIGPMNRVLRSICVFCGSQPGFRPEYAAAAREFGTRMAENGIRLVYGAGNVGLMGVLAEAALAAGGQVIGVIPQRLVDRELAHRGITELRIVGSMHERKALMAELSDAFVALPGGLGTYEELFEVLTWSQLGIHAKPCGCLNVLDYYSSLSDLLDHAVSEGFLSPENRANTIIEDDPAVLLEKIMRSAEPHADWSGREAI
jgi:uncharacterized protein (TIGR00730 family)